MTALKCVSLHVTPMASVGISNSALHRVIFLGWGNLWTPVKSVLKISSRSLNPEPGVTDEAPKVDMLATVLHPLPMEPRREPDL